MHRWTCVIAGLYLRERRFLLLGFIYIWHAAELQERLILQSIRRVRREDQKADSNRRINRGTETPSLPTVYEALLRMEESPLREIRIISANTKPWITRHKIAFASARIPLPHLCVLSFPRKSLNEFISGVTRAPLLKWKFMHPAFNPLIQFHKLKFPARDQPRVTMALWLTARRYGMRPNSRKSS